MTEETSNKFCSSCGAQIGIGAAMCSKCGAGQRPDIGRVSNWWYLCPIFFTIIGGLIAWVANKEIDPRKARKLLIIGLIMPVFWAIVYFGAISLIVLFSLGEQRILARDAMRQSDIRQIGIAMEMYYDFNDLRYASGPNDLRDFFDPFPADPASGEHYTWLDQGGNFQTYCIYAALESGEYYVVSERGVKRMNYRPITISDCW